MRDVIAEGWRLGGTATFAAIQAQRLGLRAGVVTRAGPELDLARDLEGSLIAGRPSQRTTEFENVYSDGARRQRVPAQAAPITADDVPAAWRATPVCLIGPVCGEVPPALPDALSSPLIGVSAQGWMRSLDGDRNVQRGAWTGASFWSRAHVLFVSREDLGDAHDDAIDRWIDDVSIVVLTRDRGGARVHEHGAWRNIEAFPAGEIDPTGAGDVFATAFLIEYNRTSDTATSARFAASAAACSVEGVGAQRVAPRDVIEDRMARHPEVALQ